MSAIELQFYPSPECPRALHITVAPRNGEPRHITLSMYAKTIPAQGALRVFGQLAFTCADIDECYINQASDSHTLWIGPSGFRITHPESSHLTLRLPQLLRSFDQRYDAKQARIASTEHAHRGTGAGPQ